MMCGSGKLSRVVLPVPVAPETAMATPATTIASRKRAHWPVMVPSRTSSAREWARSTNRRMFTAQWRRVMSANL
jgi:hypothetical protein